MPFCRKNAGSPVRDFQRVNGLSVDGSVGPTTWNKLFSSTAKPNTGSMGPEIAAVTSVSPLDKLYMKVNEGGTLYESNYVIHADGYYGQRIRWFKNNWKEGSTREIFYGISDANGGYRSMINQLKEAVNLSKLFPSFDDLKDKVHDALKQKLDDIISGKLNPTRIDYDLNKLEDMNADELVIVIAHIFANPEETIKKFELMNINLEEEMNVYNSIFANLENDIIIKHEYTRDPRFVLPTLIAIRNLIKAIEIFNKIQSVVDAVTPTTTYVYNTLRAVHHFNKI